MNEKILKKTSSKGKQYFTINLLTLLFSPTQLLIMSTNTICWVFYLSLFVFGSCFTCDEDGLFQALSTGGSVSLECNVPTIINVISRTYNNYFDFDGKNLVTLNGNSQINVFGGGTFRNVKMVDPYIYEYTDIFPETNFTVLDSHITTSNSITCMKIFISNTININNSFYHFYYCCIRKMYY